MIYNAIKKKERSLNMEIRPKVSHGILEKADRFFTGTLTGRITELIQNARRARATKVTIRNEEGGYVVVQDNGSGIEDWNLLLDLGKSGWDETCVVSEDPAGVGFFSLAPREVTIRSRGKRVTISKEGWVSEPSEVKDDPEGYIEGTLIRFVDEKPWGLDTVQRLVEYSGLTVSVDGVECEKADFFNGCGEIYHLPYLGCRIAFDEGGGVPRFARNLPWHAHLINFFGQVISFDFSRWLPECMTCRVDMTGEPTGLRMLLPARTQVVKNEAFAKLEKEVTRIVFERIKARGHHQLPYNEYVRAREEFGIVLPEATPEYSAGLLFAYECPEPVPVYMPDGFPLSACYLGNDDNLDDTNAHLLAAFGNCKEKFVPVSIKDDYRDYSWAKLPEIVRVTVTASDPDFEDYVWSETIFFVKDLSIRVETSDGMVFESPVPMAVGKKGLYVTKEAEEAVCPTWAWYHLGGCEDGDTYETQEYKFCEKWDDFWVSVKGEEEYFRVTLLDAVRTQTLWKKWKEITICSDGSVRVVVPGKGERLILPLTHRAT